MNWREAGIVVERPGDYDAAYLARLLHSNGFRWMSVKIHHGANPDTNTIGQLAGGWAERARAAGVAVGGWGVLEIFPEAEALLSANLVRTYGLAHYIADAEGPHKADWPGGDPGRSRRFVDTFRPLHPKLPFGFSSFGAAEGDNLLGHIRDGGHVMDYRPWYQAGAHWLPQSYPNEFGNVYEPDHCLDHARRAGWPLGRTHLMIGNYGGWHADRWADRLFRTMVRPRPSGVRPALCGFSVFLMEQTREEDVEEYGRMIRRWWLADT